MKAQRSVFVSLLIAFALASTSLAQTVKTDFDRNTNFNQYKTYSWHKVDVKNTLWVDRIKNAVDTELVKKGWTQVATGGDVSIGAVGTTREHATLETFYNGMEGYRWDGFGHDYVMEQQHEGTLAISIFDNSTKKLVWIGTSVNAVSEKSKKNIKNLDKGVQEMFEHFPPEAKS